MLVEALQLCLGREVLHLCSYIALQPAQEALDLLLLLFVHLQHLLRQEGQEIAHHIRFLLACDEIASLVFGQAGIHRGPDLGVLAIGVELLHLCPQAGALGRGGGERRCGIISKTGNCSKLS